MPTIIEVIIKFYLWGMVGTLILFAANKIGLYTEKGEKVDNILMIMVYSLMYPYTFYKLYKYLERKGDN